MAWALAAVLGALAADARADGASRLLAELGDEVPSRDEARQLSAERVQTLYLDIVLDGRVARSLVRFLRVGDRLLVEPDELIMAGLQLPAGLEPDRNGRVSLDAIDGLQWQYEVALQRVILMPSPQLRPTQHLGYRRPSQPVRARRDQGVALDWDAYGRSFGDSHSLSLGTGLRWFGRLGSLETYGVSRTGTGDDEAYARLNTTWRYSDPDHMWTWSAGDLVSGGLAWTRPVRMAGVQWRRSFGVRPDLIIYPTPQLSGDATVPSSVELYVNNVRQFTEDVDPGPFVLSNFPRVIGSGHAVVVVTDALGRRTTTSVPLYVDYERLAKGLTDFSVEAGVLRRSFGVDSGDYGDRPVASASWRRGLTSRLTAELHGEAAPGLRLAGAGLAWSPLGRYGVVTASFAQSVGDGDGDGHQYGIGYQWYGQDYGFNLYHQRADRGYRDLGALQGGSRPLLAQDRALLWLAIPKGSLSLSWLRYRDRERPENRTVSLGLTRRVGSAVVSANAFHDDLGGNGVALSLHVPLGDDFSASFDADHRDGDTTLAASVRRDAPYAGGWGWEARAQDDGDGQLSARWRTARGEFWFGLDRTGGEYGAFAQGNGSLVWMDGHAFASRRIGDAFAVVSTNGFADVPILYENRVAGRTDEEGYLLLADLRGWQHNRIGIDPDGLPANIEVPKIERLVTPVANGGLRLEFALQPIRAAIVIVHEADGQPVAAGTHVQRAGDGEAVVGFDGELWLQDYIDGETLRWEHAGSSCQVTTPVLSASSTRPRLGPLSCTPMGDPP